MAKGGKRYHTKLESNFPGRQKDHGRSFYLHFYLSAGFGD
jgi:hypothetical protein